VLHTYLGSAAGAHAPQADALKLVSGAA
jgi:hypothetical protein